MHPACADALIDEAAFDRDERLPYWADLWPSARALARRMLDADLEVNPAAARAIELGCGLALPSLALLRRGANVLATDYEPDGLAFAQANAARNGLGALPVALLDWRKPDPALGRFDLVLAADVLYELRHAEALVDLLGRITRPGGRAIIADPRRRYAGQFTAALTDRGWRLTGRDAIEEPVDTPNVGPPRTARVELMTWRAPTGNNGADAPID